MNDPLQSLPKTPPFVEQTKKPPKKNGLDTRGMLSIVTMLVSLAALSISMAGAGRLAFDVLFNDDTANRFDGVFVKLLVLGFAFLFGWGAGLASIRGFGNLLYPYVINVYAWGCLLAVCGLYLKVIQKLYTQQYDLVKFWTYLFILLGGLAVLLFLHLLVEDHDLRPFSIPLLFFSVVQLFVIIVRYVFTEGAVGWMVVGDFTVFIVMILIAVLMLMHIGIFAPVRAQIDGVFSSNHNGKPAGE